MLQKLNLLFSSLNLSDLPDFYKCFFSSVQDQVRSQDTVFVIAGVTGSVSGREMAWQFVRDHWQFFYERYQGGALIARLLKVSLLLVLLFSKTSVVGGSKKFEV